MLVRLVAVCVVAGVMLMGGTGAVAFADDGRVAVDKNMANGDAGAAAAGTPDAGTPDAAGITATPTRKWPSLVSILKKHSVGPISPPKMGLPTRLEATSARESVDTPGPIALPALPNLRWIPVSAFQFDTAGQTPDEQKPAGRQSVEASDESQLADGKNSAPQPSRSSSPTISLVQLVPPDVPMGQPVRITNPLPDTLPIDLHAPIGQLLPPPIVMVVAAIEQQYPSAQLVLTPIMNATVPQFIAEVVVPALLSDVVVPTFPASTSPPAKIPSAASLVSRDSSGGLAPWSISAPSAPPPNDIALMGMDTPQAPIWQPPQAPIQLPQWPQPGSGNFEPMGQPGEFRAGYSDYLRNAGMAQITAIAIPGAGAILLFAVGGGFIGYRQARAGHVIRGPGIARFLR